MERSANWRAYLGDKDFYRNIAKIAIPISLQQLITVGVALQTSCEKFSYNLQKRNGA